MLNASGIEFRNEQGIFPLVVFQRELQTFKCIGSSFFINGLGIFVTARHVVINEIIPGNMMFVVQNLSNFQTVNRVVTNLCVHPFADIAMGLVGIARHPLTAKEVPFEVAPNCQLSFKKMDNGTELMGFGYPKTKKISEANLHAFSFLGTWSEGVIEDFYPEGIANLKNRCYQTTMIIESGSSGGPVFKDGFVVGINSSSFDVCAETSPLSFITPVEYLLDLQLPIGGEVMSLKQMILKELVIVESS